MRKFLLIFSFLFSLLSPLYSQYVRIGDANFLGTAAGPLVSSAGLAKFNTRFAYIFPKGVLGNLKHGDTITSLEFTRLAGTALNSSCNLKMYMNNTNLSDYGSANLYWPSRTSGATMVYDQNPAAEILGTEGFHRIPFYNKVYVFDTTKGGNLELLVEYRQTAVQGGGINWYFENGGTVNGYASNQTKFMQDTILSDSLTRSTEFHPTIIFNYPRVDNDIAIIKLYTLGKLPIPLGNPDSVQALVRNVGKKTQSAAKVLTWTRGFNDQKDSTTFSIGYGEQKFIYLPSLVPSKKGLDTVLARITSDANAKNDTATSFRLGNENVYSYRDVTRPPEPGGIGFNGFTGDFVARFYSNKSKSINQITVNFGIGGRPFKVGIWGPKTSGQGPGTLIYLSDSLISTGGNYILNLKNSVSVNGTFFVGVRQLNGNNVAFGYQIEDPVRPNTFFYTSPFGSTNWFDFHPDAPYKFLIEPRLQGDTDLAVLSADYPRNLDTLNRYAITTIAPKATIINLGAKDIRDSFNIVCEIRYFGKQVYRELLRDTLSSGQKRQYTFPKTFDPKDFGDHDMLIYTHHPSDQIRDNDTLRTKFYVGVRNDVMISNVFEPTNNTIYEYLRDTLMPTATIFNPSYNGTSNFIARCRILKGSTVLYNRTQFVSLIKFNSKIIFWPTYRFNDTGKMKVVFTVEMGTDVYRLNDTQTRNIVVFKSYDVGVDSIALPDKNKFYVAGTAFKPVFRVYNDGVLTAANVIGTCKITSAYTSYTYYDTVMFAVDGKTVSGVQFAKNFRPDKNGVYTMLVRLFHPEDLVNWNDSLRINFNVGFPYDYLTKQILAPLPQDTLSVGGGPYSIKARIRNNGFVKNGDLVPIICQIWKNNSRIYQDIKSINLDTSAQFDLEFSRNINPQNAGEHKIVVFTNYSSDVNRKNDTITSKFWVTVGRDAYVLSIDTPVSTVVYEARQSQIPLRATITNVGKLSMKTIRVYADIFYNGKLVHFDKNDDSLLAGESKSINFSKVFVPENSGFYQLFVYTYSVQDQNIFNDTAKIIFQVGKRQDAMVYSWIDPLPGSVIVQNTTTITPGVSLLQAGTDTAASLSGKVFFTITKVPGMQVYSDSATFSGLKNSSMLNVNAPTTWVPNSVGSYLARAVVSANDLFPENDTLYSAFEIQINGVNRVNKNELTFYPNPSDNYIYVNSKQVITAINAVGIAGASVPLKKVGSNVWDIGHLSPGVYVLYFHSGESRSAARFVRN